MFFRGSSLCFGKLHPDNIIHEEQSRKTSKKAYYSDLQKYHDKYVVFISFLSCPIALIFSVQELMFLVSA